jgi:hypothetical protein
MDKFVEKAFTDAHLAMIEEEIDAWMKLDRSIMADSAARMVGIAKMDNLCKALILSGNMPTFHQFMYYLMLTGFHEGYRSRMEGEGK